jgi:hypothetical protein
MKEYIYRIGHIPTGLFYSTRKGRFNEDRTNLTEKGEIYLNEKRAISVLADDCQRAFINVAQAKRYGLKQGLANQKDFVIKTYLIQEVTVKLKP